MEDLDAKTAAVQRRGLLETQKYIPTYIHVDSK
jgi:hypothetical protein